MIVARSIKPREAGAALVVALVMLALVTLLAAVSSTSVQTNLKVVQNIESRAMTANAGLNAIDQILASGVVSQFDGATRYYDADGDEIPNTELIVQTLLSCITVRPIVGLPCWGEGCNASNPIKDGCTGNCEDNGNCTVSDCSDVVWRVEVSSTDSLTGASATIEQGIQERSGNDAITNC